MCIEINEKLKVKNVVKISPNPSLRKRGTGRKN